MKEAKGNGLCLLCMEYHDMQEVEVKEPALFKGVRFTTTNKKLYCTNTNEYLITEDLMDENDIRMKDEYRKAVGLLTSTEIKDIRSKYNISQKDLSKLLDWGELTVTRYENHYVQDRAHNDILVEIGKNPIFIYDKLKNNKQNISKSSYDRIIKKTREILDESGNLYLVNSIFSAYKKYTSAKYQGNVELNLNKIIDSINVFAERIEDLYSVKLMKLLWYSDFLNYKKYKHGITGLYYFRNGMGALPKDYDKIILLNGINSVDEVINDNLCKKFIPNEHYIVTNLSEQEMSTINMVIDLFGHLSTREIVETMHEEDAYNETLPKNPISYDKAFSLHVK